MLFSHNLVVGAKTLKKRNAWRLREPDVRPPPKCLESKPEVHHVNLLVSRVSVDIYVNFEVRQPHLVCKG